MKFIKKSAVLLSLFSLTMSGPYIVDAESYKTLDDIPGGDVIEVNREKVIQNQQLDEETTELYAKISDYYQNVKRIDLDITSVFSGKDIRVERSQKNKELYEKGTLKKYAINDIIKSGDEEVLQNYGLKDDAYYQRYNNQNWEKTEGATHMPVTYLSLVRFLLEDSNTPEIKESNGKAIISKQLNNTDLIKNIASLTDIPVIVNPYSQAEIKIEYVVDKKSGIIEESHVEIDVNEDGNAYDYTIEAVPSQVSDDIIDKFDELAKEIDTSTDFKDYFKKANPTSVVNYYETTITKQEGPDNASSTLLVTNAVSNQLQYLVESEVKDEQLTNSKVIRDNQCYEVKEGKVEHSKVDFTNYYQQFVSRVLDQYDNLEEVDQENGEAASDSLREQFDSLEELGNAIPHVDLRHIKRDGDATYGVDYFINKKTKELSGVVIWGASEGEEDVNHLTSFTFSRFNYYTPNNIVNLVENDIWKNIAK